MKLAMKKIVDNLGLHGFIFIMVVAIGIFRTFI